MSKVRVLGYVMTRNEWPVLGLSIIHAFSVGVDQVVVVDHQSEDDTQDGLRTLQKHYGNQLSVYRLDDDNFYQEATTALIMELIDAKSFDWVYVFDADEFMLLSEGLSISDLLGRIPSHVDMVRYQVHNWVAPSDLDHRKLSDYSRIIDRSVPNYFVDLSGEGFSHDIVNGNINYFDVPFGSKLIVRSGHSNSLAAGAHSLRTRKPLFESVFEHTTIRAGHLPFLSRDRLAYKCDQGRVLVESGFPPGHGWQSQMLYRVQQEQQLDLFWNRHSMSVNESQPSGECMPVTTVDRSLSNALHIVAKQLFEVQKSNESLRTEEKWSDTEVAFKSIDFHAIRCIHEQMRMSDALMAERDAALMQRAAMVDELSVVQTDRDRVVADRDRVVADRDRVVADRDRVVADLNLMIEGLRLDIQETLHKLQTTETELSLVAKSNSLKIGRIVLLPLRYLKKILWALRVS